MTGNIKQQVSARTCLFLMQKPLLLLLFFSISFTKVIFSQQKLAVSSGIAIDINNEQAFKQLPLSIQWITGRSKKHSLIIKADIAIPFGHTSYDSAYTLTPGLPAAIATEKNIKNKWGTLSLGGRFYINLKNKSQQFFADIFPIGFGWQTFIVKYKNFDKMNYEVINPDVDKSKASFCSSMGAGFSRNNFVVQLHVQTPIYASRGRYDRSFNFSAPLQLTAGYIFNLRKSKQ
jgi:hypothetical protein